MKANTNLFDEGHPDLIDQHWDAVCHHVHTIMFDESHPFTFLLGEPVRSLTPEPSTEAWEAAGYQVGDIVRDEYDWEAVPGIGIPD